MSTVLLSLAPAGRAAPGPIQADLAEEAQLHFTLGLQAYRGRQFPTALAHLLQSNRLAPNSNTAFNVALCYDRLAQPAQAWRFYAASRQGDDGDADAEAAMARLAPLIGRLSIDSDPPGARVFVERRDLGERGVTPLVLALRPGRHDIIVERDGYQPVNFVRELKAGDADSVAVPLNPDDVPQDRRWVRSIVQYDGTVLLVAEPRGCVWLPDRGPLDLGSGSAPSAAVPDPRLAPGSHMATTADVAFSLDVTVAGGSGVQTTRTPLSLAKREAFLDDASAVRQWALAACAAPAGGSDREQAGRTLAGLDKPVRQAAVAVLGEIARSDVSASAVDCGKKGDCRAFAEGL